MAQVLILIALLIGGCTTTRGTVEDPRKVWCLHNEPRRDATEATPRPVLDQINAHNMKGTKWCGWRP